MSNGTIIVLNGPSSAGKTTLAHALQHSLDRPCAHLAYDTFSRMLPKDIADVEYDCLTQSVLSTVYHMACGLSDCGLGIIVDHVVLDTPRQRAWLARQADVLASYAVLFVGVFCPLEELNRREQRRGDRRPGQAQRQVQYQYQKTVYDVVVDTAAQTTADCITTICTALAQPTTWHALRAFSRYQPQTG